MGPEVTEICMPLANRRRWIALVFSLSVMSVQSEYKRYQGAGTFPSLRSVVAGENQASFYLTKVNVFLLFLLHS